MNFVRSVCALFSKKQPRMGTPPGHNFGERWEGCDVELITKEGKKLYTLKALLVAHTDYFAFPEKVGDMSGEKMVGIYTFHVPCDFDTLQRMLQFIHAPEDTDFELHDILPTEASRMGKCQCLIKLLTACESLRFAKVEKAAYDLLDEFVVELAVISMRNGDRVDVLHRAREFHPREMTAFLAYKDSKLMFTKCDLVLLYLVMKDSALLNPSLTLDQHLQFLENLYGFPELDVEPPEPVNVEDVATIKSWDTMQKAEDSEVAFITNGCNGRKFYGSKAAFSAISRVLRERIESVERQIAAHEKDHETEPEKKCSPHKVKHQKKKRPTRKCNCTDVEKKLYETPKEVPTICLDMQFATLDLAMTLSRLSDAHEGLKILEQTHPVILYDLYCTAHEESLDMPFIKKLVNYFLSTHITLDSLDMAVRLNLPDVKARLFHKLPLSSISPWLQKSLTGPCYLKKGFEIRLSVPRNEKALSIDDLSIILTRLGEADPPVL